MQQPHAFQPASRVWRPGRTPRALAPLFALASRSPALVARMAWALSALTWWCAPAVRAGVRANLARLGVARAQQGREGREVVASFVRFIADLGWATRVDVAGVRACIDRVEGAQAYLEMRRACKGRGVIVVTAHMGSFEVGLASLTLVEPRVRVVFARDQLAPFERMRARVRARLGVIESPIDTGGADAPPTGGPWMALRDALLRDEAVVLQGDRAVPGQKSQACALIGPGPAAEPASGPAPTLRLPSGPVRLAEMTGAPIVPVFCVRRGARAAPGRFVVQMGAPFWVGSSAPTGHDALTRDQAMARWAGELARVLRAHPQQWLMLEAAFAEDGA
jgi:lauroyl/myristoyl acyltransferase